MSVAKLAASEYCVTFEVGIEYTSRVALLCIINPLWQISYLIYICQMTPRCLNNIVYSMCMYPIKMKKNDEFFFIPCGKCYDCIKKKRSAWTARNMLEYKYSNSAYFVTLTYDDDKINNLDYELQTDLYLPNRLHYQGFMKRLRKRLDPIKVRYFMCHEYGTKTFRPHYHLILYFNEDFKLKNSFVQNLWSYGFTYTDPLNQARIHYVSKYLSKATYRYGLQKLDYMLHEGVFNYDDFVVEMKRYIIYKNSFIRCSRDPAIGSQILQDDKFVSYVRGYVNKYGHYPNLSIDGAVFPMPRYFILHMFSDEERAALCNDYEKSYNDELEYEASKLHTTKDRLRSDYLKLSNRRVKDLEKAISIKDFD